MKSLIRWEARFSSAHLYHQPLWSEEKNREEFGRCFTPHGHGHNYRAELEVDAGLPVDELQKLRADFLAECDRLDHRHLNFDLEEYKDRIPTTEVIAQSLWSRLAAKGWGLSLRRLRLDESDDLWTELRP